MRRFPLVLFIIILAAGITETAYGSPMADSTGYNQRLKKGIEAFYTTHWKEAEATFKALQLENPNDSRAYFFSSMIPFWKYFFGANTKQAANLFLKRSEKAIAVSLDELNENPHDTTMVLMLSGLYGYRSLIAANESQYRTAIQSGVTGFKYTRQLLALDADDPRALIGKGVFYYMMGSVPPELRWMTNMAGLSGSKRQGFNALERAAESKSYVSNDAKMILSYLYEREGQYEKSLQNLRELGQRYPQNIIFQFNLARMLEKCNKIAEAKAKYKTVASLKNDELEVLKEKSRKRYKKL